VQVRVVGKDLVDVILDRGFVRRFFSFEFIVLVFLKLVLVVVRELLYTPK